MPALAYTDKRVEDLWRDYESQYAEPLTRNVWASEGFWRLVGNGQVKDKTCGSFAGFLVCDSEEHDYFPSLLGKSFKGLVDVHLKHKSCFRYDCPVCYLSWAVHEAHAIDWKCEQLGVRWGLVEHIVLSLPDVYQLSAQQVSEKVKEAKDKGEPLPLFFADQSLADFDKLVGKVVKALKARHIVGGCLIFHGFRYADHDEAREKGVPFGWRWSPHFHILGFIYGRQAFFDSVPKMFLKDGFVVKLKEKRKTVFGTAWYQLNHAAVRVDKPKFRVARWFGIGRTEKVDKMPKERMAVKCRICGRDMVKSVYAGSKNIKKNLSQCCGRDDRRFFAERLENGEPVWFKSASPGRSFE